MLLDKYFLSNLAEPATQSQLDYIKAIEEIVNKPFLGRTKKEATIYITKYSKEYKRRIAELEGV